MANKNAYRRTCFTLVSRVAISTDTCVPVHTVGTIATILTRAAGTLVHICNIGSNSNSFAPLQRRTAKGLR